METKLVNQAVKNVNCDTLIVGATRSGKHEAQQRVALFPAAREADQLLNGLLTSICVNGEFTGNAGETTLVYTMGKLAARRIVLVGLGAVDQLQSHSFRRASGLAVRFAQSKGASQIAIALDGSAQDISESAILQATVEGALLGSYSFQKYQTMQGNGHKIATIQFLSQRAEGEAQQEALKRGLVMAEATNFVRDLVNEQPAVLTPNELANRASAMARQFDLECEILDRPHMIELGMGGLLAVAKGSAEPPKFIILRYHGAPQSREKGIALVGKGITFDSGGLSLKPAAGMEEMKSDMAGGAAVIGAMQIIAALKPAINVTALVPTTENMPDGASYHPGDILRLLNGKTIEIINTDAEGRLILADGLSYAVMKEGYGTIIDIATLTGASMVALGGKRAGLFANNDDLSKALLAAGEEVGEKFWPMPLDEDYMELIESHLADVKQHGGRYGGAITAAKILEQFVGSASWAHLDIAGLELSETRNSFMGTGATGFGARALATFVLKRATEEES